MSDSEGHSEPNSGRVPATDPQQVAQLNAEHLRLLKIFHFVVAAIYAVLSLMPLIHVSIGVAFILNPCMAPAHECMPPFFGWIFAIIGSVFVLMGEAFAIAILINGRFIGKRRNHAACLILSGLECVLFPFGTVLGVFSLIVLSRPTVKPLFDTPALNASPIRD